MTPDESNASQPPAAQDPFATKAPVPDTNPGAVDPFATAPPVPATVPGATDPFATAPPRVADPFATNPPVQQPSPPPPPRRRTLPCPFGDYELLNEIARGGMGVVYLARQRVGTGERLVALKMIHGGRLTSSDAIERFLREAHVASSLDHPHIVPIFDIGEIDGQHYFSMPLLTGGSLADCLRDGPLPAKVSAQVTRQIAEAVQHAHERGIIHRDLKPGNVLLQDSSVSSAGSSDPVRSGSGSDVGRLVPKVADFGLARIRESDLSLTGEAMGTPSYMPPEQARGQKDKISPSSDVYSLGAVLYSLLTGRPPFQASDPIETMRLVCETDAIAPRELNPQVPKDLETVCLKCLHKEPERRYASASELAEELARFERGESVRARPVSSIERGYRWCKRNRTVATLLATVLLVLSAGVAFSSFYAKQARDEANRANEETDRANDEAIAARKAEKDALEAKQRANDEAKAALKAEKEAGEQKLRAEDELRRAEKLLYAGKLLKAQKAFAENNMPDAWRHLADCKWELRGWEHAHMLWCFGSSKQTLRGHTNDVSSVSWSPDGQRILTGSLDKTAKVWDAQKGTELLTLKGHTNAVSSVSWSPDGQRILTGSEDKTAKVWDAQKGTELFTLDRHRGIVTSVCFSPDGQHILTGTGGWSESGIIYRYQVKTFQGVAKVWDAQAGTELLTLEGHAGELRSVCFSPDGQRILTGSEDRTAKVWDAQAGTELLTLKGHKDKVTNLCFTPDGQRILTSSGDYTAKVWDVATGTQLFAVHGHISDVSSVCFSPDGQRVLTGSFDDTAKVWDVQKLTQLPALNSDNTAKVWDVQKRPQLPALKMHTERVTSVCLSPDGKRILTLSGNSDSKNTLVPSEVKMWGAVTGTQLLSLKQTYSWFRCVCFSPDGQRILAGSDDGTAQVWDAHKGKPLLAPKGHTSAVYSVSWSPDGKRILTGSYDNTAKVWDAEKGQEVLTLKGHTDRVLSVSWSPDGKRILTGSGDKTAKVWDAEKGQEVLTLKGHTSIVSSVSWSPDGKRILTGGLDDTVKVWDAQNGTELLTLKADTNGVTSVCFSPDGQYIAGNYRNTARVWDAIRETEFLTLTGHASRVHSVAFSPDGKKAFAWDVEGKVLAWDMTSGQPVAAENPPPRLAPGPANSPDGRFVAKPVNNEVQLIDLRRPPPETSPWPLPDAAERKRYHSQQAALAEKDKQWFAVAFHVGRLLLDDRDNVELKRRLEQALQRHVVAGANVEPRRMEKVP